MPEAPGVCARVIPSPRDSGGGKQLTHLLHRPTPKIAATIHLPLTLPLGTPDHPRLWRQVDCGHRMAALTLNSVHSDLSRTRRQAHGRVEQNQSIGERLAPQPRLVDYESHHTYRPTADSRSPHYFRNVDLELQRRIFAEWIRETTKLLSAFLRRLITIHPVSDDCNPRYTQPATPDGSIR